MAEALTTNGETLSRQEHDDLTALEAEFAQILDDTERGMLILLEIRDRRLYRSAYGTFEQYVRERWKLGSRRANQKLQAADILRSFPQSEDNGKNFSQPDRGRPANESQARALSSTPEPQRQEVWQEAVDTAPKGANGKPKVTAAHVRRVAEQRQAATDPEPATPQDHVGQPIPAHLREAFSAAPLFKESLNLFDQITARMNKVLEGEARHLVDRQKYERDFYNAREAVKFGSPYAVCPHCKGSGKSHACYRAPSVDAMGKGCGGLGWMNEQQYARVPREFRSKGAA
jgi:hypothetical protein